MKGTQPKDLQAMMQRAIEAERKLADHGPEGHNVTNLQYQKLREQNKQLRDALEKIADVGVHFRNELYGEVVEYPTLDSVKRFAKGTLQALGVE